MKSEVTQPGGREKVSNGTDPVENSGVRQVGQTRGRRGVEAFEERQGEIEDVEVSESVIEFQVWAFFSNTSSIVR